MTFLLVPVRSSLAFSMRNCLMYWEMLFPMDFLNSRLR